MWKKSAICSHGGKRPSTYLLEHLVDVCKSSAVEVAVAVHREAVLVRARRHLEDGILHCGEFALNLDIITVVNVSFEVCTITQCSDLRRQVGESAENIDGLIVTTLEHEPPRRFWQTRQQNEDDDSEQDLECNGESPCDFAGFCERHAEINPVTDHDTEDDESAFNHDHLAATMGL